MELSADTMPDANVRQPGFHLPYAVAAPFVALLIAMGTWSFSQNARLTALETLATAPSKDTAQIAALTQKVSDFEEMYERDRINDRIANARGKDTP
jgi:hypothetical protein